MLLKVYEKLFWVLNFLILGFLIRHFWGDIEDVSPYFYLFFANGIIYFVVSKKASGNNK